MRNDYVTTFISLCFGIGIMDSNDDDDDDKVITPLLMPAVHPPIQLPAVPERRRHESPEIIDLDDADDIVYVGSTRANQRRRVGEDGRAVPVTREVINVTDSEDDNEIQFIGHNPARPQPPLGRSLPPAYVTRPST